MTVLTFSCSSCGKSLSVKDELAGKKGKCPHCGAAVVVPARQGATAGGSAGDKSASADGGEKTMAPAKRSERTVTFAEDAVGQDTMAGGPAGVSPEDYDFLAPPQAPDELGRLADYRVLKILGAGGMGTVFLAEDVALKRRIALKTMKPALAASESNRKRFLREAQTAAALEHDNIVPIYRVGEDRNTVFIAMPFLKGESLDDRMAREPPLSLPEVVRIGREMAQGLAAAHAKGLVHRDIKPANVWLETYEALTPTLPPATSHQTPNTTYQFRVKILDFGLARDLSGEGTKLTQSGAILGTPAYMAPEQTQGKPVDHRGDLFSLGVVLYRLATGAPPFHGSDTISTLMSVAMEFPPTPREKSSRVPARLSDFIMKLLEKEPQDRPQSAREVVETLAALEAELSQPAKTERTAVKPAAVKTMPAVKETPKEPAAKETTFRYSCPKCHAQVRTAQALPEGNSARCPKCKALGLRPLEKDKTVAPGKDEAEIYGLQELIDVVQPEEEPEPEKKKKKKKVAASGKRSPVMVGGLIAGGVVVLLVVVLVALFSGRGGPEGQQTADSGNNASRSTPTGGNTGPGGNTATGGNTGTPGTGKPELTQVAPSGTDNAPPPGFVALFNGKDLSGWQGSVPIHLRLKMAPAELAKAQKAADDSVFKHWKVENGVLVYDGKGKKEDCLSTAKDYGDFELVFDWKIEAGGDSGIFLRGCPQVQINNDKQGSGGLYNNQKNPNKPLVFADNPPGQWNTMQVLLVGDRTTIRLNGKLVVDNVVMENSRERGIPLYPRGPIEIQQFTGACSFKNIYLREISGTPQLATGGWITLFDGKDLSQWMHPGGTPTTWQVANGYVEIRAGPSLITKEDFGPDYELHLEFWLPPMAKGRGNSGVYLNGCHEIQIIDSSSPKGGKLTASDCGALYAEAAPRVNACKPPGEWQTFDITFQAPRLDGKGTVTKPGAVSVLLNGTLVLDKVPLDKLSAASLKKQLVERGPVLLQQHNDPVRFRNIKIRPLPGVALAPLPRESELRAAFLDPHRQNRPALFMN